MTDKKDVLARRVELSAKLEENGVAFSATSRAIAGFDRLIGSVFDCGAALFEGAAGKIRIKNQISEDLLLEQGRLAKAELQNTPLLGSTLINEVLSDKARRKINAASVAVETIEALKALPPPDQSSKGDDDAIHYNIDDDWMNSFVRYAEDASSERLQATWGRVLAGEISKPGSFSRHTLRFMAELDKETAEDCEILNRYRVGDKIFKNERWSSGKEYLAAVELQRLGLVEGVGGVGGPQQNWDLNDNGDWVLVSGSWALQIKGTPGAKISLPVIIFTRLGREVMSLLVNHNDPNNLRELSEQLDKTALELIIIGEIISISKTQFQWKSGYTEIWRKP